DVPVLPASEASADAAPPFYRLPFYQRVAQRIAAWITEFTAAGSCGAVTGATYPRELAAVRAILPGAPPLIPGVADHGGAVEEAVRSSLGADGYGAIISASRSITYASTGDDYAAASRAAALSLRDTINAARETVVATR